MCGLDARYYCNGCWEKGGESIIPSRLLHNWDSLPRAICGRNKALIQAYGDEAIFRIDNINPKLYDHCQQIKDIKAPYCVCIIKDKLSVMHSFIENLHLYTKLSNEFITIWCVPVLWNLLQRRAGSFQLLRDKLAVTVSYLLSCRESVAKDIKERIRPKEYLYKDVHLYSFTVSRICLTFVNSAEYLELRNKADINIEDSGRMPVGFGSAFRFQLLRCSTSIVPYNIQWFFLNNQIFGNVTWFNIYQ